MITRFVRTKTEGAKSVEGGVGVKLSKFKSSNHGFWQFVITSTVKTLNVKTSTGKQKLDLFHFLITKHQIRRFYIRRFLSFKALKANQTIILHEFGRVKLSHVRNLVKKQMVAALLAIQVKMRQFEIKQIDSQVGLRSPQFVKLVGENCLNTHTKNFKSIAPPKDHLETAKK